MFHLPRRHWLAIIAVLATLGVGLGMLEEATGIPAVPLGMAAGALMGVLAVHLARRRKERSAAERQKSARRGGAGRARDGGRRR